MWILCREYEGGNSTTELASNPLWNIPEEEGAKEGRNFVSKCP